MWAVIEFIKVSCHHWQNQYKGQCWPLRQIIYPVIASCWYVSVIYGVGGICTWTCQPRAMHQHRRFSKNCLINHMILREGGRCKQRRFMWGKAERSYYPGTHPGRREGSWLNCRAGRVRITGAVCWNGVIKCQKLQIPETSSGVERGEKVPYYLPWKMKLYICIIK